MTPGSAAVYLNAVSVLRMTVSEVLCMSAALLGSLVIFCLISLGKHIGIFLLTLKACGNKNSQIKKEA